MVEVFDKPNKEIVEEPVAKKVKKPRKKRAPLSEEQKKALVERLKKARDKKKALKKQLDQPIKLEIVEEPKPAKAKPSQRPTTPDPKPYRQKQNEIQELRDQLEIENLKHQLNESRNRSNKKIQEDPPKNDPVTIEEPQPIVDIKPQSVVVPDKVDPPKKIRSSLAPKNIWGMF